MFCEKCGKEIPDDVKFCRYCGNNTEENGSENESGGDSTSDHGIDKGEHKEKKHKRLIIIMIAIVVLALVAALIYLGSRYMMGGEATQEKAIAKAIEAVAYGDLDAYEEAANKDFMNHLYTTVDVDIDRNEMEAEIVEMKRITEENLGKVKKIDAVYIESEENYSKDELDDFNNDALQGSYFRIEEANECDVYVTYTDTAGNQLSNEYGFIAYEEGDGKAVEVITYKIKGKWYARIEFVYVVDWS